MIQPSFEPHSGWYRRPTSIKLGSPKENQAKREASFACVVFRMRVQGKRLQPSEIIEAQGQPGALLCSDEFTHPQWHAVLYELPAFERGLFRLHDVRLMRQRGWFRQYAGREWNERASENWPQTWFCAPSLDAGIEVLRKMEGSGALGDLREA